MNPLYIILGIIAFILLVAFSFLLTCFMLVFYSPKRKKLGEEEFETIDWEIYKPYLDEITDWTRKVRKMPRKSFEIKSDDGLTLRAKYYEYEKGAPIEILFHGYRGSGERDLSVAVQRCFHLKRNAFIVDHRASGESEGHVITFGIKERRDALKWIDLVIKEFGDDVKIMITGISMGAATVMMLQNEELPKNVLCSLADCGYSSPKEIIIKVMRENLHLPAAIFYPAVKLSARIFGRFDLEEVSALSGVKKSKLPIIFIHGTADDFVPSYMSCELYEASVAEHKSLVLFDGVGHGLAFLADREKYYSELLKFEEEHGLLKPEYKI